MASFSLFSLQSLFGEKFRQQANLSFSQTTVRRQVLNSFKMTSIVPVQKKLIIDCDAGIDDAQAILLALSKTDVDLLAVTCVSGNVHVEKVCVNVLKTLEMCGRTDIPVYKGADRGLMGKILCETIFGKISVLAHTTV